jgi:large subunit ribosomal protein L6
MAMNVDIKKVTSRLARKELPIPNGVQVTLEADTLTVKGPKGSIVKKVNPYVVIQITEGAARVEPNLDLMKRMSESKIFRSMTGTFCSHIHNMIHGVTEGFTKELEIVGVGYRAALKGKTLNLSLGYAHEVNVEPPEGISFEVPSATKIIVKGYDKEVVGQTAANIRKWREPLVYGGKGIRYAGEMVRTKVGKKV